jgi:hypothetical protein
MNTADDMMNSLTTDDHSDLKSELRKKYQETFIDRLSPGDLQELQFYQKNLFDNNRRWNTEYKLKFESKLRQYFHEEVLRREIASIEVLVGLLVPGDLENR